jgi:hypothetical protein
MLAFPVLWDAALRYKWLEESLHPGLIVDVFPPTWLIVVGIVFTALGFRQMAKRETASP